MGTRKIDGMGCPDRSTLARSGLALIRGSQKETLDSALLLLKCCMPDSLRVPPAHDIPMVVGVDLTDTVRRYRSWLLRGAGPFGYAPARASASFALEHSLSLRVLENQCRLTRPPSGHEPNIQVIRSLWRLGGEKAWRVFDPPKWRLPFRAGLSTPILADRLVVESERPFLFWMQMRTGVYAPTPYQLALLSRLFLTEAARQGEEDAGLLIADMPHLSDDRSRGV